MAAVYGIRGDNKCKHEVVPAENFATLHFNVSSLPSGSVSVPLPEPFKDSSAPCLIVGITAMFIGLSEDARSFFDPQFSVYLPSFNIMQVGNNLQVSYTVVDFLNAVEFYVTIAKPNMIEC